MVEPTSVLTWIKLVYDTITLVERTVKNVQTIGKILNGLRSLAGQLEAIATDLEELLGKDQYTYSCVYGLQNLNECIQMCHQLCAEIGSVRRSNPLTLLRMSRGNYIKDLVNSLTSELDSLNGRLTVALQVATMHKQNELAKKAEKTSQGILQKILNPSEGIFTKPGGPRPTPPSKPRVSLNECEDGMIVEWEVLDEAPRYDVNLFTDHDCAFSLLSDTLEKSVAPNEQKKYSVCFTAPIVLNKERYQVTVRAVNDSAASEWSEPCLFTFQMSPLKVPPLLKSVNTDGPSKVIVEVLLPEFSGHQQITCNISYTVLKNTDYEWKIKEVSLTQEELEKKTLEEQIKGLIPFTMYRFRVSFSSKFEVLRSPWSNLVDLRVDDYNVRIDDDIQAIDVKQKSAVITWKKPKIHPESVKEYRIKYRQVASDFWTQCETISNDRIPYTIRYLNPNTCYEVKIVTINRSGQLNSSRSFLFKTKPIDFLRYAKQALLLDEDLIGRPLPNSIEQHSQIKTIQQFASMAKTRVYPCSVDVRPRKKSYAKYRVDQLEYENRIRDGFAELNFEFWVPMSNQGFRYETLIVEDISACFLEEFPVYFEWISSDNPAE